MSELFKEVESLVKKAAETPNALPAVHFSQAALNAAQALSVLADIRQRQVEP